MHFGSSLSLVDSIEVIDSQDHSPLQEFNNIFLLLLSSFESNTAIVKTLAARAIVSTAAPSEVKTC
jgi:hypothetical protein